MRIRLLGPVQVGVDDARLVPVGPAQRCLVLAALAVDAGRWVSQDTLVDRVWGRSTPRGAWRTVHTQISSIRGALTRIGLPGELVRVHRNGGYLLDVEPGAVDVHRLRHLAERATALTGVEGLALWREAVALWHGEPLTGLAGPWVERSRQSWWAGYRDAVLGWSYAEIKAGDPAKVIGPLNDLVGRYPLVEAVPAMLMRALYALDRRTEALDCYGAARQRLDEELAERPGAELQAVHQAILRREADPPPPGAVPKAPAVPAQLPADVRGFAGRTAHLAQLDTLAETAGSGDEPTAVVISAIAGTAGVGKTAFAVHWAHRAAKRFPDGQLYVNLHGFDPTETVTDPGEVIRFFLDALGVPAERVPADPDARTALYRTLLADKRMLIVLDNARDSAQVRPLLPGAPGCLVLVTSRNRLTSLVAATGAYPLPLDLLTADEAHDLLTRRLGARRVGAEPDAVDTIVAACARLPLALALVAARAATRPQQPLAVIAATLHERGAPLETLADTDPSVDVRTVFSWSYTALTRPAQRLFRLLGLHPGPDISTAAAASLAALTTGAVRPLLAELTAATMLTEHRTGRYAFHDLLRAYVSDLTRHTDPAEQRRAATLRMLDHYLHTAHLADRLLMPTRDGITLAPARLGTSPESPTTFQDAVAWFTAEHRVLLAAVNQAVASGLDSHTWQLAWTLATYLDLRGHWQDRLDVGLAAKAAADRLADPVIQMYAYRVLATSYLLLDRTTEARGSLERVLEHAGRVGDPIGLAHTHVAFSYLEERLGHFHEALHHSRRAVDLYTSAAHRFGTAMALNAVGWLLSRLGEHAEALDYCRQALTLYQEVSDISGEAASWNSIGFIHHHLGNPAEAITSYRYAISLFQQIGDRYNEADNLATLGDVHDSAGDHAAADRLWRQALAILIGIHHPDADKVRARIDQRHQAGPP